MGWGGGGGLMVWDLLSRTEGRGGEEGTWDEGIEPGSRMCERVLVQDWDKCVAMERT